MMPNLGFSELILILITLIPYALAIAVIVWIVRTLRDLQREVSQLNARVAELAQRK